MLVDSLQPFSGPYRTIMARAINKIDTTDGFLLEQYKASLAKQIENEQDDKIRNSLLLHQQKLNNYLGKDLDKQYTSVGSSNIYYRHEVEKLGYMRDFKGGVYISLLNHLDVIIAWKFKIPLEQVNKMLPNIAELSPIILQGKIDREMGITLEMFGDIDESIDKYIESICKSIRQNSELQGANLDFASQVFKQLMVTFIESANCLIHLCMQSLIGKMQNIGVRTTDYYSIIGTFTKVRDECEDIELILPSKEIKVITPLVFRQNTFNKLYSEGVII